MGGGCATKLDNLGWVREWGLCHYIGQTWWVREWGLCHYIGQTRVGKGLGVVPLNWTN